jgi:hypothetical protein
MDIPYLSNNKQIQILQRQTFIKNECDNSSKN